MTDIARTALAAVHGFPALGNERFEADGATFIRNRTVSDIRDANHVAHVTASTPQEIDRLLARVEREFAGFPYRRFHLDFTTPPFTVEVEGITVMQRPLLAYEDAMANTVWPPAPLYTLGPMVSAVT